MPLYVLSRHPHTPCTSIERIEAALDDARCGILRLTYRLIGDANRVIVAPRSASPRRRDGLWHHTCCELFVRDGAGSGYCEYNFASSGDWAAYRFSGYRAGRVALDASPPRIALERSPAALELTATLSDRPLDALNRGQRIGLACVVETATELSYWALAHAPGRPDFHDERAFALMHEIDDTVRVAG